MNFLPYAKRHLLSIAIGCTLLHPALAEEAPPAANAAASSNSLSSNLGLYSQYIFRGIKQTDGKPALQGGVDYSHASGWYAGLWASNVSWISDGAPSASASLELDFYGGYKKTEGDFSYDVGVLRYQYPGHYPAAFVLPHTTEVYGQIGWKMLSLKYSHSVTDTFGVANSKNSSYLDFNASLPVNAQISLNLHAGHQRYAGDNSGISNAIFSYTDYKLEGTYAIDKEWTGGLGWSSTNAQRAAYTNPRGNFLGASTGYAFIKRQF